MSNSKISKRNFNKALEECVTKYTLNNSKHEITQNLEKSEAEYQKSFDDIITFSAKFTSTKKKAINAIVYNKSNNDGLMSGYIAWRYLYKENKKENLMIFPLGASSGTTIDYRVQKILPLLKDKNVLIMDLQYGQANIDAISNSVKSAIIIDDHTEAKGTVTFPDNIKHFIGNNDHAAVAYTWKFFYPKERVPLLIQYIDNSDRKLNLAHTPFSTLFANAFGFRYAHNPFISHKDKSNPSSKYYINLDEKFDKGDPKLFVFIGKYFDEVTENLKQQIAVNNGYENFQGYRVTTMNFNAPSLTTKVLLQLLTNAERDNVKVDFAVTWGWEYGKNAYSISMHEKRVYGQPPKYNLPQMAKKLAQIGGHKGGGGGTMYKGHFYWPRKPGMDIWDLFKKKFI